MSGKTFTGMEVIRVTGPHCLIGIFAYSNVPLIAPFRPTPLLADWSG